MSRLYPLCCLLLLWARVQAATLDDPTEALQGLLVEDYYAIEFFVFERDAVTEQNAREMLALARPRAFPYRMRTQRLDPDYVWNGPIDELTRSCLTYPTLEYALVPPEEEATPNALPVAETPAAGGRPPPRIAPKLEPHPQLQFMRDLARFEESLAGIAERWLPADEFVLGRAAARVERAGVGRILFHGRWLQAVPPRDAPLPVLIQAGTMLNVPDGVRELEGTVGVTLGRYLHFRADLYYHAPGLGLAPAVARMGADGQVFIDAEPLPGRRYMQLSESVRMRSTETHYLDHPKLGVVVRIDPVSFPPELVTAFQALEENAK